MKPRPEIPVSADETLEPFGQGRLWLVQKKHGYRFSLDAVLLAGLTELKPGERVMDLGTGCGIVALMLACRQPHGQVVGVESQATLASLAERNVSLNALAGQVEIIATEMQNLPHLFPPASFDVVVSNPPYRPLGCGRINPLAEKALARHELLGSLEEAARAAAYLLPAKGRFGVIYPAWRLVHLCCLLRSFDLEPKQLRLIHSYPHTDARLVWVEARRGGREELKILPPLTIYQRQGCYSPEIVELLSF